MKPIKIDFDKLSVGKISFDKTPSETSFDVLLKNAMETFRPYERQCENLLNFVQTYKVKDEMGAQILNGVAGDAKDLADKLDETRKKIIKEPDTTVRKINAFVKKYRDKLTNPRGKNGAYELAMAKLGEFHMEQKKKLLKAQAKINKDLEKSQIDLPIALPENKTIESAGGKTHFRKEWTYEVRDISKVPSNYLLVDDAKIKATIKAGIRDVPGLHIYETSKPQYRRNTK